jgi:uncharacterized protein (DUF1684 family)
MKVTILLALTLALFQSPAYRAEIEKHRTQRVKELRADDGWLTVAGLFWLNEGENVAGSAQGSHILLPSKAPAKLGVFELKGGKVTFTADPSAHVTAGGQRVTARPMDPRGGDKDAIHAGDLRMFVMRRGDRFAIRMRDLTSAARQRFDGLTYFPLRADLRVQAAFTPFTPTRKIPILNVLGQTPEMESPGYVTFTLDGRELRLEPVYETQERSELFFIFSDLTSRDATYPAGRYVKAPLPRAGIVDLDFNKAYNPPCAFTDFATCPLPPKQNQLPVRVEAGELRWH